MTYYKPLFRVQRPEHPNRLFPLIRYFWFTSEEPNPWRCENCVTEQQRQDRPIIATEDEVRQQEKPRPEVCRKCGLEFI